VASEYRDMLRRNTNLHKLLLATMKIENKPCYKEVLQQHPIPGVK
jgi:hypothetical protein